MHLLITSIARKSERSVGATRQDRLWSLINLVGSPVHGVARLRHWKKSCVNVWHNFEKAAWRGRPCTPPDFELFSNS